MTLTDEYAKGSLSILSSTVNQHMIIGIQTVNAVVVMTFAFTIVLLAATVRAVHPTTSAEPFLDLSPQAVGGQNYIQFVLIPPLSRRICM